MSLIERIPLAESSPIESRLPSVPEQTGEPQLWLRREQEGFRASFALRLCGVTTAGAQPAPWFWPPVLLPQHALEVTQNLAAGHLHCTLRGYGHASTETQAIQEARQVWRNLEIILGDGQGPYQFATVIDADPEPAAATWQVALRPLGLTLHASAGIGYQHEAAPFQAVRLAFPARGQWDHFDTLALNAATPLAVTLRCSRCGSLRPCWLTCAACGGISSWAPRYPMPAAPPSGSTIPSCWRPCNRIWPLGAGGAKAGGCAARSLLLSRCRRPCWR